MKRKILTIAISFLAGAIVATSGFCIYTAVKKSNGKCNCSCSQKGEMKSTTDNDFKNSFGNNGNQGQPPEMPDGNNGNFSRGGQNSNSNQFPQMPGGNSNSSGGSNSSGNQQAPELPSGQ